MTTLVLLRHAKSSYPPGVGDHDRPLNARGLRDAPVAGRLIAEAVGPLELALVSTARRAQQTYELAAGGLTVARRVDDSALYLAHPSTMLERIRGAGVSSLMVVAHNPGTEDLASLLAANITDPDYAQMAGKFPTAAFAVLQADTPLHSWEPGCARLAQFGIARG